MWYSFQMTTTHSNADSHARLVNRPNGNAYLIKFRSQSFHGIFNSWDLPVRDNPKNKPCISFSARKIQPTTKSAEAKMEEDKGIWPFVPARTAVTEG